MGWTQLVFGILLVAALVAIAGYYAWRQVQALRQLREAEEMPPEERRYIHSRAWRRLLGCALMLLFAALFVGALLLERPAKELIDQRDAAAAESGEVPELTAEQKSFARVFGWYWIALLLVLMALLATAAFDLLATRRYTLQQFGRLQADRRAMIERQAARLRQQRNGQH